MRCFRVLLSPCRTTLTWCYQKSTRIDFHRHAWEKLIWEALVNGSPVLLHHRHRQSIRLGGMTGNECRPN